MTNLCDKCDDRAMFDGFGHKFCWKHYSEWIRMYFNTLDKPVKEKA